MGIPRRLALFGHVLSVFVCRGDAAITLRTDAVEDGDGGLAPPADAGGPGPAPTSDVSSPGRGRPPRPSKRHSDANSRSIASD